MCVLGLVIVALAGVAGVWVSFRVGVAYERDRPVRYRGILSQEWDD